MSSFALLLSGGVDSAVALSLLKDQFPEATIEACYLKIWLEDELAFLGECPWEEDLDYVRRICEATNTELNIINLQTEYLDQVVGFALDELRSGRTPSPDIHCNERIKFGAFFDKVEKKYDGVASGHYARIEREPDGLSHLMCAPDPVKDQTYFLSNLSQQQLSKIHFPIGHLPKKEVRRIAEERNLPPKHRKDSQGICFLGKIPYREFVKCHLGENPGDIIEKESGKVLGQHQGSWFHTIGQRKGLGLGGGPWFVVDKNFDENTVFVSHQEHFQELARKQFLLRSVNWNQPEPPRDGTYRFKLRHGPNFASGYLKHLEDERWSVSLEEGDPGIASGQHAVVYDGEECLGGGVMELDVI